MRVKLQNAATNLSHNNLSYLSWIFFPASSPNYVGDFWNFHFTVFFQNFKFTIVPYAETKNIG